MAILILLDTYSFIGKSISILYSNAESHSITLIKKLFISIILQQQENIPELLRFSVATLPAAELYDTIFIELFFELMAMSR